VREHDLSKIEGLILPHDGESDLDGI